VGACGADPGDDESPVAARVGAEDLWQAAELLQRVQAGDAAPVTLASLEATVFELCCQRNAIDLRAEAQNWLQHIGTLLRKPVGLRTHRDLLVMAGWLALLVGCVEYDLGMRAGAEATRVAAQQLGAEAEHSEILGWTHELAAWFALTQGRYADAINTARAGQAVDGSHSVVVQFVGQEAKALGRIGNVPDLRAVLNRGQQMLNQFPPPGRTDNHFIVDPDKWFYAMDAYRLAGADELAAQHARNVIEKGTAPGGIERSPMRMAKARLALGVIAARKGELEQAIALGREALSGPRKSLPSLLMVAGELDGDLSQRYPNEQATGDFRATPRPALNRYFGVESANLGIAGQWRRYCSSRMRRQCARTRRSFSKDTATPSGVRETAERHCA
jgi:tetratricopeptide (TPR) repeat protein